MVDSSAGSRGENQPTINNSVVYGGVYKYICVNPPADAVGQICVIRVIPPRRAGRELLRLGQQHFEG